MCIQERILATHEANTLKHWLEGLPRKNFFPEERTGRFGLRKVQPLSHCYINPHDSWFPVTFNEQGNVISEEVTKPFEEYLENETLKKVVIVALEAMAQIANWQNETCEMAISVMQHHNLSEGASTKAIPWHRDASDHTLVILLDESLWEGGDFLFKKDDSEAIERFQPRLGYGVFFSNEGTKHSVEPLKAAADGIDRTILTIHHKNCK